MFLIYINDITEDISSQLWLFADDVLLYHIIKSEQDSILFQQDLDTLSQWAENEVQPYQVHCYEMYKDPQSYNCKLLSSWVHFICNKQTYTSWSYVG